MSFSRLGEDACQRHGWTPPIWERLVWHGGLHLNRRRVCVWHSIPAQVSAGTQVVAYRFLQEPEPVLLTLQAVCLDRNGVIAVDKPPWLPVQGTRASIQLSLETQVQHLLRCMWLTPAHRLDRETSGVLVFATNSQVAAFLHNQFEQRVVHKAYLAWVSPPPRLDHFVVQGYLRQVPHPRHAFYELYPTACPGARNSETRFQTLAIRDQRALVAAFPVTGRTHQIRAHLAASGSPILGDALYGRRLPSDPSRLLLHAARLSLRLPGDNTLTTIVAPPPADFCLPSDYPGTQEILHV